MRERKRISEMPVASAYLKEGNVEVKITNSAVNVYSLPTPDACEKKFPIKLAEGEDQRTSVDIEKLQDDVIEKGATWYKKQTKAGKDNAAEMFRKSVEKLVKTGTGYYSCR